MKQKSAQFKAKDRQPRNGFTLIELLVVIAIMTLLTTAFLANFAGQNATRSVEVSRNNMVSDMRVMQSYSLSSRDVSPGTPASAYSWLVSSAWGPNPKHYMLYEYDQALPNHTATALSDISLTGSNIKSMQLQLANGTFVTVKSLNIFFNIPYGKIAMTYTPLSGAVVTQEKDDTAFITIQDSTGSATRLITVNGVTGNIF